MIDEIHLENWRPYVETTIGLGPGTTFVIAENGVGKTSLILAMQWALFGDLIIEDARPNIRLGSDQATVRLTMSLANGRQLSVSRTVTPSRKLARFQAEVDGDVIDKDELPRVLADEFGAEASVLASLCVLPEFVTRQHQPQADEVLRGHLSAAFGVDNLRRAEAEAEQEARDAARATRQARNLELLANQDRDDVQQQLGQLRQQLSSLEEAQAERTAQLAVINEQIDVAERWEAHERLQREAATRRSEIAVELNELTETSNASQPIDSAVTEVEEVWQAEVDAARGQISQVEARIELTRSAQEQLSRAEGDCPVCLRPLDDSVSDQATHTHEEKLSELHADLDGLQRTLQRAEERLTQIRQLRTSLAGVPHPQPPTEERPADDLAELEDQRATLREQVEAAAAEIAAHRNEIAGLDSRLEEDDRVREARSELQLEFRREALALSAAQALKRTADEIVNERLKPIHDALQDQWGRMMGQIGVLDEPRLDPEGPVLHRDGKELQRRQLSGGEQAIIETLTRLLVLTSTTSCRFLWLDEPLEHLDPRHRRLFAASFAQVVERGTLEQVVITTYEEPLARRLRNVTPSSRLTYVAPR